MLQRDYGVLKPCFSGLWSAEAMLQRFAQAWLAHSKERFWRAEAMLQRFAQAWLAHSKERFWSAKTVLQRIYGVLKPCFSAFRVEGLLRKRGLRTP